MKARTSALFGTGFLHPLQRELEPGNPTKHVSITTMQIHELLEAVKEHIGRALHEERPQETLEVLNSIVRALHAISVTKPLLNRCFTFQTVAQSWPSVSLSNSVKSHQSSIACS